MAKVLKGIENYSSHVKAKGDFEYLVKIANAFSIPNPPDKLIARVVLALMEMMGLEKKIKIIKQSN